MDPVSHSPIHLPSGKYTKQDLCFGKYFKAVSKFGRVVLKSAFLLIYQTLDTKGGTLLVRDYCLHNLQWSGGVYNKTFNASERQILGKAPTSDEFVCDISLLFKIIMHVLGNLSDPIKKEIRDIKNLRNSVCHEDLRMDEIELEQCLKELQGLCRLVLEGVAAITGQDLTIVITEVEDGLNDLLVAKLEQSDISDYLQELNNFRQQKCSKMISEGRKELMLAYSKVKILNPCSWLSDSNFKDFTVENVFTNLKLVDCGTPVLLKNILNVATLRERFVPRVVILRGVMGAGKTSLYRYLLQQWCCRSPDVVGLMAVDIVIAMEMRAVSCGSLVQFLREQLLKATCQLFSESDIIPVLQDINVLFLIDGMDEATSHGKAVVREIVHKFTDSSIIVTTRPEFTLELMRMAEDHVVIQVEGFDSDSQKKYVENIFSIKYPNQKRRDQETQEFLKYRSGASASLKCHLTLPLTLALLLILWCDDSQMVTAVTTTTCLYSKIYEMCRQKLIARLEAMGAGHCTSLRLKVQSWMVQLGQVAWDMMCEEVLSLNNERADHLISLCDKEGIDPIQTLSTFLKCDAEHTVTGAVYSFSFHHSSSQEFLAAYYVSEQLSTSGSLVSVVKNTSCSRFQEMIIYVAGLQKINCSLTPCTASEIIQVLRKSHASDSEVWARLLKEAECDPAICKAVGLIVSEQRLWVVNSWDPPELTEAKASLVRATGAAPCSVVIQVKYTTRLEECPEVQDILRLIGTGGKSKVRLYLDSHFSTVKPEEEVDSQIAVLLKANMLLEFKGHAGPHFASQLVTANRIQALFIRVTSMEALTQLQLSFRKHRRWKTIIKPSSKWSLRYVELTLDLDCDVTPEEIPRLHYHKQLVVKLGGLSDNRAEWAGQVLQRLSHHYSSVILQSCNLSLKGLKLLLDVATRVTFREVRVLSDQPVSPIDVQDLAQKSKVKIGWGVHTNMKR